MKWLRDRTGRFPKRLFFESLDELDLECERLLEYTYFTKRGRKFVPPLTDDALEVLIGEHARLDLYATIEPGVEAVTEFRPSERPLIKVSQEISSDPRRRNRLRTGLTHEWFHATYHKNVWELLWTRERIAGTCGPQVAACHRSTIIEASEKDWLEFQAGYGSCALLMPRSWLDGEIEAWFRAHAGRETESGLIQHISGRFEVSTEAARWRLRQRGAFARLVHHGQATLW